MRLVQPAIAAVTVTAAAATAVYVWWRRPGRPGRASPAVTAGAAPPVAGQLEPAAQPGPSPAGVLPALTEGASLAPTRRGARPALPEATRPPVPGARFAIPGARTVLPVRGRSLP